MKAYAVIGNYEFGEAGNEFFVHHVEADTPQEAARKAVQEMGSPARVVAVFSGHHKDLYSPDNTLYDPLDK